MNGNKQKFTDDEVVAMLRRCGHEVPDCSNCRLGNVKRLANGDCICVLVNLAADVIESLKNKEVQNDA